MNKKNRKSFFWKLVLVLVIVALLVSGATYAFWVWTSNVNKNVFFNTPSDVSSYVEYNEGESYFVGNFQPVESFCDSTNTTISFRKTSNDADLKLYATIKMDVNSIGSNITQSSDVYWVVTSGDNMISCDSGLSSSTVLDYGTFNGVLAGETLTLSSDIELQTTVQSYTIWIWIDNLGSNLSNLSNEFMDTNVWTEITMGE